MIIYTTMLAVVLLAFLLYTLPLRISRSGRTAILIGSVCLAALQLVANSYFSLWFLYSVQLLLAILITYILVNRLQFSNDNERKEAYLSEMDPLFSFVELQERAKMSETVDEYYASSVVHVSIKSEPEPLIIQEDEGESVTSFARNETMMNQPLELKEDSSEFIDFTNREIVELNENTYDPEIFSTSDEEQVFEARKKIFENLEAQVAASIEDEQHRQIEVDLAPAERLSLEFDDLEEMYLKKKQEGRQ